MVEHRLPVATRAVVEARKSVRDDLSGVLSRERLEDVELLTSELVANAVQHAELGGEHSIRLVVSVGADTVRVSVVDAGPGFPSDYSPDDRDVGGWGLLVVQKLSDGWGVDGDPHTVWFELRR